MASATSPACSGPNDVTPSARVFETILPALYTKRARRLGSASPSRQRISLAYESEDVRVALEPVLNSRGRLFEPPESGQARAAAPDETQMLFGFGGGLECGCPPIAATKAKEVERFKMLGSSSDDEDGDVSDDDIWAALEEACRELGMTEEQIAKMLRGGEYTMELLRFIASRTGCNDLERIRAVLDVQKPQFLARVEAILEQKQREKTRQEQEIQVSQERCQSTCLPVSRVC